MCVFIRPLRKNFYHLERESANFFLKDQIVCVVTTQLCIMVQKQS